MIHGNEDKIRNILLRYDDIVFALFFGSYVTGKVSHNSDLDIGIFCGKPINIIQLGKIITEIEKIVKKKVDLVVLNDLYKKSPLLSYEIVTNSFLIFNRNELSFTDFKRKSFLYYFDSEKLRKIVRASMYKRISSKQFGNRNYA